ncbi:hypothetical protein Tco_1281970 [Tanacetum coccineum]
MSNSNINLQTQSSNALHNAIMEAGSKDRPPMLAPGNYVQWKSRIKRYIDTKPNSELIHYCLQNPPYTYQWAEKTVPVAEGSSETTTERYMENYKNVSQDIRDQLNAEAEAVQIILTGIDNDIYSTVDACPNACEMWKAIERLKQGESINVQDLETNLYWEFGKFTSRDGESLESYYSRFYKMMNELVNTCSEKEESNSETASSKSVKECSLNSETKDVHAIKYKMSKAKERCMAYFRSLHSHLQVLSKGDSKGTRIEHGFKREFMSLFGQDVDTFTRTMLLNVDQLQKQLDKDEFQEDGSMTAFWVVNNQFQKFIDSKFTLDYDSQMTDTYFVEYTGIEVQHFRDYTYSNPGVMIRSPLLNEITSSKTVETQQCKMTTVGQEMIQMLMMQISFTIYDEEPMDEVQLTAECNIFAIEQQHTEQPEIINEGRVD